jgi:para-aminobenzoate synthetase component 1
MPQTPNAGPLYLAPRYAGRALWTSRSTEVERLALREGAAGSAQVHAFLRRLDEVAAGLAEDELAVFLIGYEAGAALDERAPRHPRDPRLGPDAWLRVVSPEAESSEARRAFARWAGEGGGPPEALELAARAGERPRHMERVAACREHLFEGTLYQANLAHRVDVAARSRAGSARFFLERTATREPPFAAWVDDAAWGTCVTLSPECFLAWDLSARRAAAYPIKGTRPRGATPEEDARLLEELRASEKDAAEHLMIVDLLRNDLGRVASAGGVSVTQLMRTLTVPNVHHLETEVSAQLRAGARLGELLAATLPGGSITGAPKTAAVDVIAELESGPRGAYTGILGVVDRAGRGASSILIRTWLRAEEGAGALHVGGGIVVDSEPAEEWQETLDKAAAFGVVQG